VRGLRTALLRWLFKDHFDRIEFTVTGRGDLRVHYDQAAYEAKLANEDGDFSIVFERRAEIPEECDMP